MVPASAGAGGVGSYAVTLAEALAGRFGLESRWVAARRAAAGDGDAGPGPDVSAGRDGELGLALSPREEAEPVLLHYVGYGYQRRGCPRWLLRGLARWRKERPGGRLVTLFHEVYATGPPWTSSFWLSPLQRRLARRLAGLSDGLVTSLGLYGDLLARWRDREDIAVMPVFSTVGEPEVVLPFADREPRLAVFGGAGARARAYGELGAALARALEDAGAEGIDDLGPPLPALPAEVAGRPVRGHGYLPAPQVSALLSRARAGFVAYPAAFLAKSTIFAAYAAHGLAAACAWPRPSRPRELLAGRHFWSPASGEPVGGPNLPPLAAAAREWYAGHRLESQAPIFRRLLLG